VTKSWPGKTALIGRLPAACQTSLQIKPETNNKKRFPRGSWVEFFVPIAFPGCLYVNDVGLRKYLHYFPRHRLVSTAAKYLFIQCDCCHAVRIELNASHSI